MATTKPTRTGTHATALAARRHPLVAEVARRFAGECNVPTGSRIVVAVSGGADSCALLLACAALAKRKASIEIVTAHVHHHLRAEADEEAAFVEALAKQFGVPFVIDHVHPAKECGSKGANARRLRYDALQRVAKSHDAAFVATAHHAEDQLETMIMALGRGTGLRGLRGMRWRRSLGEGVTLVRPMLLARKRDCEELCTLADVSWREDASNVDPRSKRARVRRDVLPILEELWPGAARRSTGTAELIDVAGRHVAAQVEAVFGDASVRQWERDKVAALPVVVIAEGLRRAAEQMHGTALTKLSQRQLRAAAACIAGAEKAPKRFAWPGGITVEVTSKRVSITRAK